ncbi:helix-turn-helix domain-containing protein [Natronoglomus mannanivorans]|uniref:Helix-turn-helix domain-containing protein n=1 Tax=Natronoglomus mannanivorans TaxID=2979990 RepID=A0AAP2Z1C9_9EURY|nr:helix-turn-helix domain-containing protein [Halobacteria archaeon AArc-xg1-1]
MALSTDRSIPCNLKAEDQRRHCNPDLIVDTLSDDGARDIFFFVDEPATVKEISDACEIPTTTAYRKVETLVESGLIEPVPQEQSTGVTTYAKAIECVSITYDEPMQIQCVKHGLSLYCEP